METYKICLIFVMILLALYIISFYRYPKNTSILQTSLNQLSFDALLQRQLLVIDDTKTLQDINDIVAIWFKYSIKHNFQLSGSDTWHKNRYKYLVIQAGTHGGDVYFYPPYNQQLGADGAPASNENVIAIRLSIGQSVVVPFHWKYMIPLNISEVQCIGIHDLVTYVLP